MSRLLGAKHVNGVDSCRTASGQVACQQHSHRQKARGGQHHGDVPRLDVEQQMTHEDASCQGANCSERAAYATQPHRLSQDETVH